MTTVETNTPPPAPACPRNHCSDYAPMGMCPHMEPGASRDELAWKIQDVWREYGPENERLCDWTVTFAEPWSSIARALGVQP